MNISSATSTETCVFEKWNPFLVFESNSHKQFGEWEMITTHNNPNTTISTIPTTTNNHPFVPTPNFFNCSTSNGGGGGNTNMSSSFVSSYGGGSGGSSNTTTMNISYPKLSDYSMAAEFIGLDLGGRTYFSSQESAVIDRLFKRPRGFYLTNHVPRCQAQGCGMDLTNAKHYHKRHKVCEIHSKANTVLAGGLEQRFCQQCSRFHLLAEFDKGKRSCRKRLADHNRRRRKPPPPSLTKAADEKATSEVVKKASSSSSSSTRMSMICTNTFPSCATAEGNNVPIIPHRVYEMSKEKPQQWQQESIFNDSSTMGLFERELLFSSFNEVTPPMGGNFDVSTQQQRDIQNLLHLDRAFFEGDLP